MQGWLDVLDGRQDAKPGVVPDIQQYDAICTDGLLKTVVAVGVEFQRSSFYANIRVSGFRNVTSTKAFAAC